MEPTATPPSDIVERRVHVAGDPATAFRYWTEPDLVTRWMGRSATLEAEPGGQFRVDYNGVDVAAGTFVSIDPPRALAFTWGWEAPGESVGPGASRVEVSFEPEADGTVVTVRHLDLPADARQSHAEGWDQFLPRLADALRAG